jgi:hypothetical protein
MTQVQDRALVSTKGLCFIPDLLSLGEQVSSMLLFCLGQLFYRVLAKKHKDSMATPRVALR